MNFISSLASDLLNGFSANDIPVFLSRIFISAFVAYVFKLIFKKKYKNTDGLDYIVSLSILLCIVVPIAQFSISLGIIIGVIILGLLLSFKEKSLKSTVYLSMAFISSITIGSGYVIYALLGLSILFTYLLISKD